MDPIVEPEENYLNRYLRNILIHKSLMRNSNRPEEAKINRGEADSVYGESEEQSVKLQNFPVSRQAPASEDNSVPAPALVSKYLEALKARKVPEALSCLSEFSRNDRALYSDVFLYSAILLKASPDHYASILNTLLNHAIRDKKAQPSNFPRYIDLANPASEVTELTRDRVLKLALNNGLLAVMHMLIERDPVFDLETRDLNKIVRMGSDELIDLIVDARSVEARRRGKENIARNIIERLSE